MMLSLVNRQGNVMPNLVTCPSGSACLSFQTSSEESMLISLMYNLVVV